MAKKKWEWPKGAGTYGGLLPKSLSRNAVLSLADIHSLPDVDRSGLFPMPFIAVFHREFSRYQVNDVARRALVQSLDLQGPARTAAVTFVVAMRSFLRWKHSDEQEASERQLNTIIKHCGRKAKKLGLKTYYEEQRLAAIRKLLRRQTVARWQAYVTYGFALDRQPEKPTPHVLEEFRDVLTLHAHDIKPRQVELGMVQAPSFDSIRSNVFRFLSIDANKMTDLSRQHFDALRHRLNRGTIPLSMRIGQWK